MSIICIDDININYKLEGKGKDVVLLHGWGQKMIMMDFIYEHLKSHFRVLNVDLPGHGDSDDPKRAYSVEDYCNVMVSMFEKLDIKDPIIIGHSFGCRIAFHYASQYSVNKMILCGAAGLLPKRGLDYKVKTGSFKLAKKVIGLTGDKNLEKFKSKFGSTDYKNVTGVMRETFVKVVNDDVSGLLNKIFCPVILIFGENDDATPLWMGKELESKLHDGALIVFENDDHYAYFHQPLRFLAIVDSFLEGERIC